MRKLRSVPYILDTYCKPPHYRTLLMALETCSDYPPGVHGRFHGKGQSSRQVKFPDARSDMHTEYIATDRCTEYFVHSAYF